MAIKPIPKNLEQAFNATKYQIDFYQRQYKWSKDPVERLLDDLFYKFNIDYAKVGESLDAENASKRISQYFLNTYVTNEVNGNTYLVDGQQRFTTLTLIFIQLFHLGSRETFKSELVEWIKERIYGTSGPKKIFYLNHVKHLDCMKALFDNKPFKEINTDSGKTAANMVLNSRIIRQWLEKELTTLHRYDTFVYYLLTRIEILNLDVVQDDVPMVFEVINDRGVNLKPHEILKGKLLGQIDKEELNTLGINEIWDRQVDALEEFGQDEIDQFFETYIRSKIVGTRGISEKYTSKNYHRILFTEEVEEYFKLNRNPTRTKVFLRNEFIYFTNLYIKIRKLRAAFHPGSEHLYFNQLNDLNGHFVMILSACKLKDPDEVEKIKLIGYHYDRIYTLLHLQKAYVNNVMADLIYAISQDIREKSCEEIPGIFEVHLIKTLTEKKNQVVEQAFSYNYFKDVGYADLPTRFNRYFLSRIEHFIAKSLQVPFELSFDNLVRNTGPVNGYHIEHILGRNDENLDLFNQDEDVFERERNRLGGLLLLRGNANQSSGKEKYSNKLDTYSGTLIWNETLIPATYHSNLDLNQFNHKFGLGLRALTQFGPDELEERHKLLAKMVEIIWK